MKNARIRLLFVFVKFEYFDESKDELFLHDVAEMLDNVLQYFIDHAPGEISRAKYSAMRERSIGRELLASLLQSKMITFECNG